MDLYDFVYIIFNILFQINKIPTNNNQAFVAAESQAMDAMLNLTAGSSEFLIISIKMLSFGW